MIIRILNIFNFKNIHIKIFKHNYNRKSEQEVFHLVSCMYLKKILSHHHHHILLIPRPPSISL